MYAEPPSAQATVNQPPTEEAANTRSSRKPPLRLGMVFGQAIALLLPMAYLFFDAFAVLSDQLFLSSLSGSMNLTRLMERLSTALYAGNTVGEIAEATLDAATPLWQSISFSSLLAGEALSISLWLPLAISALMIFFCVVCAFLLLLTGGRILRLRSFTNLTLLCGTGAVFSPLLGSFALRLFYCFSHGVEDADTMMQRILPSLEHLCIMGILACALLPALSSLKSISAYARRQNKFLSAPFGALEKSSFRFKKALLLLSLIATASVLICFFCLPITTLGALNISSAYADFSACHHAILTARNALAAGNGATVNFLSVAQSLLFAAIPFSGAVLLLSCLPLLITVCKLLTLRTKEAAQKKSAKRVLSCAGKNVRGAILAPYISFVLVQMVTVLFLLFFTPVLAHINFSNVDQTLSVLYLTVAHVRVVGGTETLYTLMSACGVLLWHLAGSSADAMLLSEKVSRIS